MIEIHTTNYDTPIHCIQCGKQTVSSISNFVKKGSISICPHLVYLGNGCSDDYDQTLQETLNDEHLCLNITCSDPHPSRYFVIYNLGRVSKEEYEECPFWIVWGPTLEKYGVSKYGEWEERINRNKTQGDLK